MKIVTRRKKMDEWEIDARMCFLVPMRYPKIWMIHLDETHPEKLKFLINEGRNYNRILLV